MRKFVLSLVSLAVVLASACAPFPVSAVKQGTAPSGLWFTQAPPGARVSVDGADGGEAALYDGRKAFLDIPAGPHRVVVRSGQISVYDKNIYLGAGARMEIKVTQ